MKTRITQIVHNLTQDDTLELVDIETNTRVDNPALDLGDNITYVFKSDTIYNGIEAEKVVRLTLILESFDFQFEAYVKDSTTQTLLHWFRKNNMNLISVY